jgi:hypothetical protein
MITQFGTQRTVLVRGGQYVVVRCQYCRVAQALSETANWLVRDCNTVRRKRRHRRHIAGSISKGLIGREIFFWPAARSAVRPALWWPRYSHGRDAMR